MFRTTKGVLWSAVAVVGLMGVQPAKAELILDLRMSAGSIANEIPGGGVALTFTPSGIGGTYSAVINGASIPAGGLDIPIEVWARLQGADQIHNNDGLTYVNYAITSGKVAGGSAAGAIKIVSDDILGIFDGNIPPFAALGQLPGATSDYNGDGFGDLGVGSGHTAPDLNATDPAKPRAASLQVGRQGTGTNPQAATYLKNTFGAVVNPNYATGQSRLTPASSVTDPTDPAGTTWEMLLGTYHFHVTGKVAGAGANAQTTFAPTYIVGVNDAGYVLDVNAATDSANIRSTALNALLGTTLAFQVSGGVVTNNLSQVMLSGPLAVQGVAGASTLTIPLGSINSGTNFGPADLALKNFGTDATDANAVTLTAAGAGLSVNPATATILAGANAVPTPTLSLAVPANIFGPLNGYTVTIKNTTATAVDGDDVVTITANVKGTAALGQTMTGSVPAGSPTSPTSYAALTTKAVGGTHGTEASILYSATAHGSVSETWRNATAADNEPGKFGVGTGAHPTIISDILTLTGTDPNLIVLQMSYDDSTFPNEAASAAEGDIMIVSWNGSQWVNTVDMNHGAPGSNVGPANVQGAWSGQLGLGTWGVDTVNNVAWAVIDHNTEFAVVPEPATIGLLVVSALGLCARRRRRTA